MRTNFIVFLFLFGSLAVYSQGTQKISGKSAFKEIRAGNPQLQSGIKAAPDLVIKDEVFKDADSNNFIDGNERSSITINIENLGAGDANSVTVKVGLKNKEIQGLEFDEKRLVGTIKPGEVKTVSIPLTSRIDLTDGIAEFKIEVQEGNGFDAFPLEMKIETHAFQPPKIVIADAAFSTEKGGTLKLNSNIFLKFLVQNIGKGPAQDVAASCILPNANCMPLTESDKFAIGLLKPGETRELTYSFIANRRYSSTEIPVQIDLSESFRNYAHDTTLVVRLEQNLAAQSQVVITGTPAIEATIVKASLTSDVDKNIPVFKEKNPNRYALIIGNEDYSKYQKGITSEMNVIYAGNDATVFKEYVVNTLGFEESNVLFLIDATSGELNQKVDLICKFAIKTGNDAEILFYYAGHGLPDETTKIPYLIPVDVNGSNLNSAIKLSDIYLKLSQTGAKRITVFLDACFSGGGRTSGLLAARSVKIKPTNDLISGNMVSFTASSLEQSALPYQREKHGLFTYFLLKKIQETKGNITYGQLSDYMTKTVSLESLKINQKEQDPTVKVSVAVKDEWMGWRFR